MKKTLCLIALCLNGCSIFHDQCAGTKAKIGMSRDELLKVCGKPGHINGSAYSVGGIHEQFVYSTWLPPDYVYVENNSVSAMQW